MARLLSALCAIVIFASVPIPNAAQEKDDDKANMKFADDLFPMRLSWTQGDDSAVLTDPGKIPSGKLALHASAYHIGAYTGTFVRYRVNGTFVSPIVDGKFELTLKKGDNLEVVQMGVAAPGHAAIVRYRDGQILVALMYAIAISNEDASFNGKEEFRSSALFVAKYGYKTYARKLAEYAQANLANAPQTRGNFRNDQQIAVLFPLKDGKLLAGQAAGTEDELAEAIEVGLHTIKRQFIEKQGQTAPTRFIEEVEAAEKLVKKQ